MNNEILDSLRRISCGMEIVMRDVIESVEDLDDRLLLVECMDDFYGGDNWELFKRWMELEEVFMWLYDLSNE